MLAVRQTKPKNKPEKMKCTNCKKEIAISNFYKSTSPMFPEEKATICKGCIAKLIDIDNMDSVYQVLQMLDVPFLKKYWDIANNTNDKNPWGAYITMCNSGINEFKGLRFKDSIYEDFDTERNIPTGGSDVFSDLGFNKDELIYKWGSGYDDEELKAFERKYEFLKDNYPQVTAMHTEALLIYIRYRVKEEFATASGDISQAEKWGKLADKASERAKINPSQLSKADLTGGLNSFGEVGRAVERARDIISILPRFVEKPQDKVDFTLWCYINYARRMKNLPDVDYKEIYKFYEERKNEYKKEDDREFEFEDEKS